MLHFIPAWYQQDKWCENEQFWHVRRMHTEFDDTVKQIQLFHRNQICPYQILLLSFTPNFRHFLHRQGVFHAPYWSCFDTIQEVRRKKPMLLSYHNLKWPSGTEFIYTPFVVVAMLNRKRYAQIEFGEDGNPIQVDLYKNDRVYRRNIYDDRGFVSSTVLYGAEGELYQDYLMENGEWKLRVFRKDGHVEINPKHPEYLLMYQEHLVMYPNEELVKKFSRLSYGSMEQVIYEVLCSYLQLTEEKDIFCVAMHERHAMLLHKALKNKKKILSFFMDRYPVGQHPQALDFIKKADYIIADSKEGAMKIQNEMGEAVPNLMDITPYDSRVDFGISQQLNVQKILVPVDGLLEEVFGSLIRSLGEYLRSNRNAQIHLFTRNAAYNRKSRVLEKTRKFLKEAGLTEGWAAEEGKKNVSENRLEETESVPVKFFVEQCVDELEVSKCMREQRIVVDMREAGELYLQITAISMGIPQIVHTATEFVEHGKNGFVLTERNKLHGALDYYLDGMKNWNEAMVYSYELGKKYAADKLIGKWKEVIDFVG